MSVASVRLSAEAASAKEQAGRGSPRAKGRVCIHQQRGAGTALDFLKPSATAGQGGWLMRPLCGEVGCECCVRCGVPCGQQRCKHFPSEGSLVGLALKEAGGGHLPLPWAWGIPHPAPRGPFSQFADG